MYKIPGYQLTEKLSENASYQVYRGVRSQDGFPVLLRVLNQPHPTAQALAFLWQEYEILRGLDFPGVEKIYALENHDQRWMLVVEDFGGMPLDRQEIAGRMEPEEFLNLALQMVETLAHIHAHQIIHKNISPPNIFYNPSTRQTRLANFGGASWISKEKVLLQSPYKLVEFLPYISPEMTGRMNRSVDYRADYYSLGATLYELLTGTPPFLGETPLELVYAHLAVLPVPPASRVEPWKASAPAFQIISAILLKLLAKNPEGRYQTHGALRTDLRQALSVLQEPASADLLSSAFITGQDDRPDQLNIPQLVVGREQETEALLQAFLRTISGPAELVLVSGEAGVGKTTLVNQLVRPVTEKMGLFLYAKFDQVRQQEAYHAFTQVLDEFCRLVLSEPMPSFSDWRERLQAAVTPHGQLLIELCPQLEKVIGLQPPVEPIDETLTRLRFYQVVIRFLQAVCRPEHPVVIFLDDMQWINLDSTLLWQSILSASSLQNLLVVGAYREDEVLSDKLINRLVQDETSPQRRVTQLRLENLDCSMIGQIMAAALASDPAEVSDLVDLVCRRTGGNPYFSKELLKSLYQDRLLSFDQIEQKWRWDRKEIEKSRIVGLGSKYGDTGYGVVDLFVNRILNLREQTQKTLQYAALIGRRFDTETLLTLLGEDKADVLSYSLREGIHAGLIYPLGEGYRLLFAALEQPLENSFSRGGEPAGGERLPNLVDLLDEGVLFEFQHDRVQQAAVAMLDKSQFESLSLQIGWLLLEKAERGGEEALLEEIFEIVDYLNSGSGLIIDLMESIQLARLNLMASRKARDIAAFKAASSYLSAGMQLLPEESWQSQYELTLEIFTAGADVALLNGDLARAEALALSAEAHARTLLEKVVIIKTRMEVYTLLNRLDQVVELGVAAIKMFGFDPEVSEPPAFVKEQTMQLPALDAAQMTEPHALVVSRLAEPLLSAALGRNDRLLDQLIFFYLHLFSQFGNPPGASFIYAGFGMLLINQFEQVELGYQMGEMAFKLAEKEGLSKTLFATRHVYYTFIIHWVKPAREGVRSLLENVKPAFESGNLGFAIRSLDLGTQTSLFVGFKLEQVWSKYAEALGWLDLLKQKIFTQRLRIWMQVVLKLMGEPLLAQENTEELFGEEEERLLKEAGQSQTNLFNLYAAQAFFSLLFREPQQALATSASAHAIKMGVRTQLILPHHLFIYSLALLSAGLDDNDLPVRLEQVEENLRLMRRWAGLVPENFLHQVELVEAELARCLGQKEQAAEAYEKAIQDARRNGYIHESALAAELAAEFYLAQGDDSAAKEHLLTAFYSYQDWGAKAKIADLVRRYPEWLPPGQEAEKQGNLHDAMDDQIELTRSIDLNTVLKASLELAREMDLKELLRKLMSILIENAGAQYGALVLAQEDRLGRHDRWVLEIQGSAGPEPGFVLSSTPLDDQASLVSGPQVPVSIINYVINSKADLVLTDASTELQFSQDAYVQSKHPKSILCSPLLNQGVLSGVIYLENNLTAGAFTAGRLEVVKLISGQAAVSIEKVRLYENLEALVEERTRALSEANQKLSVEIEERNRVEEALRLSEVRYRTVFENTGTAMCLIDEQGEILLVNDEFVRLTGYSKDELDNKFQVLDVVAPVDQERVRQIRQSRLEDPARAPNSYEFQLIDRSGLEKTVLNTAAVLPGSRLIIISLLDITQTKQVELALQKSEALYRAIVNIQTEMVCRYSPALSLTFVNQTFCDFMGKPADQLIGQSFLTSMLREGHEGMRKAVRMMLENPGDTELDQVVVTTSGELRWQRWLHSPIVENGRVVEFQAVGYDITEQKTAEDALRYNETLLRRVLEILPVGIWVMDKTPQVILGNPESQRIWADARYVEMQNGDQYFAWRVDSGTWVRAEAWAGRLAITRGQTTLDEELEIETFDGDRRFILNSAIPLVIEGEGLVGAIVVNQDITRRKQNEGELQRAHDQLSTLLHISQSIVSTLDLDPLLSQIIEQLGTVLPYDAAAILILEQNFLQFRVVRGPSFLQSLSQNKIPISEPTLIAPFIKEREPFYIPDLQASENLSDLIREAITISYTEFTALRTWLAHPLIAKDGFIGILVLAHSQPDYYSSQTRILSQAYANQVAIAIHNAQLYQQAGSLATLEERNRLARELHDSVAQALYSISLFTDAMRRALETNRLEVAKQHLEDLVEVSKEAMADMRLMIFELRPPILEKVGLVSALQSRLDSVESRAGFKAIFQADSELHFSSEQEGELYRIAQESLNNVIKHAQADWVKVQLAAEPGIFRMTIEDNGVGFDLTTAEQSGGQGIRNIRERSERLGAVCRIESTPGLGTKITIEVNQ